MNINLIESARLEIDVTLIKHQVIVIDYDFTISRFDTSKAVLFWAYDMARSGINLSRLRRPRGMFFKKISDAMNRTNMHEIELVEDILLRSNSSQIDELFIFLLSLDYNTSFVKLILEMICIGKNVQIISGGHYKIVRRLVCEQFACVDSSIKITGQIPKGPRIKGKKHRFCTVNPSDCCLITDNSEDLEFTGWGQVFFLKYNSI